MLSVDVLLLIVAATCFILDALRPILRLSVPINLTALGLFFWIFTALI